ncbi:transport protein [Bacillus sp. JCM 19046]|nr:transport protein [Bacillus sp. JCM 19045]GAF18049.1 transport protein [Bacillus sp. JCM 19046]
MIGTLVNVGTILIGSLVGHFFKRGLKEAHHEILMQAMGLAVVGLGVGAIATHLPASNYPVLFIVSLAIGGLIGEWTRFEDRFNKLLSFVLKGNTNEGLTTAILLFCVGTLSIVGPIEAALNQNYTYLFSNAILDGVTSIVLASTFGLSIAFSAVILFVWQGSIYLFASFAAVAITADILTEISIIGGVLILSTGLSILGLKKFKTMNLLPAMLVPIVFFAGKALLGF